MRRGEKKCMKIKGEDRKDKERSKPKKKKRNEKKRSERTEEEKQEEGGGEASSVLYEEAPKDYMERDGCL